MSPKNPGLEDPTFFWDPADAKYKALFHQGGGGLDGGYAQSRTSDFFSEWDWQRSRGAYGTKIQLANGSVLTVSRRERPKVYIENGTLEMLINGVCLEGDWSTCFTFGQKISRTEPWLTAMPP